jgi:hypothetical protein
VVDHQAAAVVVVLAAAALVVVEQHRILIHVPIEQLVEVKVSDNTYIHINYAPCYVARCVNAHVACWIYIYPCLVFSFALSFKKKLLKC